MSVPAQPTQDPAATAVLVSGLAARVESVAAVLRARGMDVTDVSDMADLPEVCGAAGAGAGAFSSYVQLSHEYQIAGGGAIDRVHSFYADGVLARFPALAAALPALTPGARITFVMGTLPEVVATSEDFDARRALTMALSRAARADAAGALDIVILPASATTDQIADAATRPASTPSVAAREPDDELSYAEWRVQLFGLVYGEG